MCLSVSGICESYGGTRCWLLPLPVGHLCMSSSSPQGPGCVVLGLAIRKQIDGTRIILITFVRLNAGPGRTGSRIRSSSSESGTRTRTMKRQPAIRSGRVDHELIRIEIQVPGQQIVSR